MFLKFNTCEKNFDFDILLSMLLIQKDEILIDCFCDENDHVKICNVENNVFVVGLTKKCVASDEEVFELINEGN